MGGGPSKVNTVGRPVVLIVGGGYAGIAAARLLDPHFFVVLIDRKDHFAHYIGLPRGLVEPEQAARMHISYQRLLLNGVFVQAHVTAISPTAVHLAGITTPLTFDYLIIATGSSYHLPSRIGLTARQPTLSLYTTAQAAIKASSKVLIIGAGPVGVEIAGEVATDYPDKEVTLVSAHDYLGMPGLPAKFYAAVDERLRALRVTVVKGSKIVVPDAVSAQLADTDLLYLAGRRTWTLSNGTEVESDLTFFAVGSVLNTSALSPFASTLTPKGELPTNASLQVNGYTNIFALGDVNGLDARKLGYIATEQGNWLGKHLPTIHAQGGSAKGLKPWKAPPPALFLSLGRRSGAGTFDGNQLPVWVVKMVKSGDLFTAQKRKDLRVEKGDGEVVVAEGVRSERMGRLVSALKVSEEDAKKLVQGIASPPIKSLPARNHL